MRRFLISRALIAASLLFSPLLVQVSWSAKPDQNEPSPAAKLVRDALAAEVQGDSELRARLLYEASVVDPNYGPARWQAGFVRVGDDWLTLEEAQQRMADDPRWNRYRERRDALVDTAQSHRELARWCEKNRMKDVAQVHWMQVLRFNASDPEASQHMTADRRTVMQTQRDAAKRAAIERKRLEEKWGPRLKAWKESFEKHNEAGINDALAELAKINDAADLPVLFEALSIASKDPDASRLRDAIYPTLGNIRSQQVTDYFLSVAMNSAPSATRDAAMEQLKKRPAYAFVPKLLAALPPEITAKGEVHLLPNGAVINEQKVRVDTPQAEYTYSFENVVNPADLAAAARTTPGTLNRELQRARALEGQVRQAQQQGEQRRQQIEEVLTRSTEFADSTGARDWQEAYDKFYAVYAPSREKQYLAQQVWNFEHYYTIPVTTTTTTSRNLEPRLGTPRARPNLPMWNRECFAAGTLITTEDGSRPVESLKLGDRVLAQELSTGELVFKPVLATTLRPATKIVEVRCGTSAPIMAAEGHPFWVIGQGWKIARDLKPGDRLHSIEGAVMVDAVQAKPPMEAYNLVVQGFHTYFVGEDQLLVHDNAPLVEQPQQVPGL